MKHPFVRAHFKLWTSHFIKIMFVGFTIGICTQIQLTTLPLYAQHLGGSKTIAGLMMGIFTISALIFRPLAGAVLDNKGRRVVLVTGAAVFMLASFSYYFVQFIWLLLLLRFIHGAGFSAYSTSTGTIVSDLVPKYRLMEGIGYYGMAGTLAAALGPALGFFLVDRIGLRELYLVVAGISAIGLAAAFFTNYEKEHPAVQADLNVHPQKSHFFVRSAVKPSVVMFFIAFSQGGVISFLPSFALTQRIGNIGIFFTVNAVAMMLSRPVIGKMSDRFGASRIILPGMLLLISGLALIPFATSIHELMAIGVLYGIGSGTAFPLLNAITIKMCPAEHLGAGNAAFLSAVDAGYGTGSILWGVVSQLAGFAAVYFGAAGMVAVSLIIFMLTLWKSNISS